MALRVVIADDEPKVLRELASVLSSEFQIVAKASDGNLALDCIREYRPDVAVLDLRMPGLNGLEVTRRMTDWPSRPAVVICSVESDPDVVEAALQAGALGYVLKSRIATDLIPAVNSVSQGSRYASV